MRLTTIGRYSTLGVWVTYRLEDTEELLWRAPQMVLLPVTSKVGHLGGGAVIETWYKIEGYKAEFDREEGQHGDPPQEYVVDHSDYGVCCLVSSILP